MNAFDKVIGYKATKRELLQLCDMLRNREIYEEMGARLPHGLLLYGDPGLGKTLLARCFVEESGLHTITVRRDKGGDAFIDGITQAFASAKTKAPSIVLLDDMDKFANEDDTHCDAPEYAAVQAGIDDVKDAGVFVIATANDIRKLPSSLRRSGRFDRKIGLQAPTASDAEEIIAHYLKTKRVSGSVNMEDLTRMMRYNSCAELETILNEAAVRAAFARKTGIDMEDMVSVVLKQQYDAQEDMPRVSDEVIERVALHEAGHLVVCEALCPGSVGFASLFPSDENRCGGFTYTTPENIRCRDSKLFDQTLKRENMELYFRLGGADYLQACREIAYDHREPTPTLEDAVCGMAGTVAAICALCEDENSEVSDLARELYYSSLLLQELVEWYQSRRQEQENYEEEYEQYHGFDMTMM